MAGQEIQDDKWVTINLDDLPDAENESKGGTYVKTNTKEEDEKSDQEEGSEDDTSTEDEDTVEKTSGDRVARKSRAQERIRKLVKERNDDRTRYQLELQKMQERLNAVEETSFKTQKESVTSQNTLIDQQINSVKAQLKRATEDADHEAVVDLTERLADLKVDKRIIDAQAKKLPEKVEKKVEVQQRQPSQEDVMSQLPDEMRYYIEDNPWVLNPETREERRKVAAIRQLSNELVNDGYSEAEPDFYDELDKRLAKKFGKSTSDDVEYNERDESSDSRRTDVKEKEVVRKQPHISGASRSPSSSKNRGRVHLSREERDTARKLNLSEEQYARSKRRSEESNGGWTTID